MRISAPVIIFAAVIAAASAQGQFHVVPNAFTTAPGTTISAFLAPNMFAGNSRTLQVQYPASQFASLPAGTSITGISLRLQGSTITPASWPPPGGFLFSSFEVTMGSAANPLSSMSTTFNSNYFSIAVPGFGTASSGRVVRSGPLFIPAGSFSSTASPNPFCDEIPIAPVTYNGGDMVVTLRVAASTLPPVHLPFDGVFQGTFGSALFALSDAATTGSFSTTIPIIRFTTLSEFQRNQPAASLDHDGIISDGRTAAVDTVCTGAPIVAHYGSTLTGFPYDIAVALSPLVARSAATSTPLADGQVLNVPLGHPSLVFLWSGSSVPAMVPSFPFSLPFNAPGAPVTWSSQAIVINPSSPTFLSLSQGNQVTVVSSTQTVTAPGPSGDDATTTVRSNAPPFCGLAPFVFYGTTYTECHVSTNGRVTFEAPDASSSPTLAAAATGRPFAGFWTDLSTNQNSVVITQASGTLTVNYNAMNYVGENPFLSFAIRFEANGRIAITNLGTVTSNLLTGTPSAGDAQMLGICNGHLGASIVNSPFPFGVSVNGAPQAGLVDFWPGTVSTAPNGVGLVRTIQDNQLSLGLGTLDFTPTGTAYQALNH